MPVQSHYARNPSPSRPALTADIETETCIIGGGLAGIATALDLAERGRPAILLEANQVGWGASGRNGGFVSPGFPGGLPALIQKTGLKDAQTLYALSHEAQQLVRTRIDQYAIDCGPIVQGALRCAMANAPGSLQTQCDEMAQDFGVEYTHWPQEKLRAVLSTPRYKDAYFNPYTFTVDPLALTRGLATAAESQGAKIFEFSRVLKTNLSTPTKTIHTTSGKLRAKHVVFACGGYIENLQRRLANATIPIATFVMATEPLGAKLDAAIAVPYAISDIKTATNYYRKLADGRLLWGGRVLAWQPKPARIAQLLHSDMACFYPGLADAKVETSWGGMMPYLRHKLPVVGQIQGRAGGPQTIWFATGFGGLGMALTTLAGRLIGSAIADADDRWRLLARFGLPFAGGKLGRIPAQLVYWRHQLEARLAGS